MSRHPLHRNGGGSDLPPRTQRPRRAWRLAVLTIATLVVAGANLYMVKHRHEGYLFRYLPYGTVYSPAESLRVAGFERLPGELLVRTEPAVQGLWEVSTSEGARYEVPGPHPRIRLEPGVIDYRLQQRGGAEKGPRAMELTVVHAGAEEAGPEHMSGGKVTVLALDVPLGDFERLPLSQHAARVAHYSAADVARGREMLARMDLPEGDDARRIERLVQYLLAELDDHRGVPSDAMMRLFTPLEQYEKARAGEEQVFCANFASIYTFFATLAGIPTREISVTGERDGVTLGAHTFTESYLPEDGGWAYVDLTFGLGLVRGPAGTYLNAIELSRLHDLGVLDGLIATVRDERGRISHGSYAAHARFARLYLNRDATYLFHRPQRNRHSVWARVRRLLFEPELAYAERPSNVWHYLKVAGFSALLALGALWVRAGLGWFRRRRRPA